MSEKEEPLGRARGGIARAKALSADVRKEIARKAAETRWAGDIPQASHDGPLNVGGKELMAAVLPDGTRLLSQGTFLLAIGRSRTPKANTGALATVDRMPFFLSADVLKPFISQELLTSTAPVFFRLKSGKKGVGYDAHLLPMVCDVYLKFRDDCLEKEKKVPRQYEHIVRACDVLIRGLATVGIIALIDEATGYQEIRDKRALQEILDKYLRKELAAWAKRFPDEFYRQIFRLRGWEWKGMKVNRPQVVANYTNDFVWSRITPGLLTELEERMPKDSKGRNKGRYPQLLTEEVGDPALAQHLHAVVAFMRAARNWDEFKRNLNAAFPKKGSNLEFEFVVPTKE